MNGRPKITGEIAVKFLENRGDIVRLHKKDNTDKLWSYKVLAGRKTEFAFDPNIKTTLNIWMDCESPDLPGISDFEDIRKKTSSTALTRVFSGGALHTARFKFTVADETALKALIDYFAAA